MLSLHKVLILSTICTTLCVSAGFYVGTCIGAKEVAGAGPPADAGHVDAGVMHNMTEEYLFQQIEVVATEHSIDRTWRWGDGGRIQFVNPLSDGGAAGCTLHDTTIIIGSCFYSKEHSAAEAR